MTPVTPMMLCYAIEAVVMTTFMQMIKPSGLVVCSKYMILFGLYREGHEVTNDFTS